MKSQDVVVALGLSGLPSVKSTYATLAANLGLSASETHAALARLVRAGIATPERQIVRGNLLEFMLHGLKYAFPAAPGGPTLGVPTGASAPMLMSLPPPEPGPWVWPWSDGSARGLSIEPLYPTAPGAALRNEKLYELLALVDALRAGRARERNFAEKRFTEILS